jgi:hypothetical protein
MMLKHARKISTETQSFPQGVITLSSSPFSIAGEHQGGCVRIAYAPFCGGILHKMLMVACLREVALVARDQ